MSDFKPPSQWTPESDAHAEQHEGGDGVALALQPTQLRPVLLADSADRAGGVRLAVRNVDRKMIARQEIPQALVSGFAAALRVPRALMLHMEEHHTGLAASTLYALIPIQEAATMPSGLVGTYGIAVRGEDGETHPFALLRLGAFHRAVDERKFGADLHAEADDQLAVILGSPLESPAERMLRRITQGT